MPAEVKIPPTPLTVTGLLSESEGKPTNYEVSMCPARRTVNGKSICPASVNHVSYRVRSRGFS